MPEGGVGSWTTSNGGVGAAAAGSCCCCFPAASTSEPEELAIALRGAAEMMDAAQGRWPRTGGCGSGEVEPSGAPRVRRLRMRERGFLCRCR